MHERTLGSIKEWYKRNINSVGFVLLETVKGHNEKRLMYISETQSLLSCIRDKIKTIHSPDLKRDLGIMEENVEKIHNTVRDHNLNTKEMHNYKEADSKNELLTFHSVSRMYKGFFQKIGWSLLAITHGHSSKLHCLMDSFSYLHRCLKDIIPQFKDKDNRKELEIILDHVDTILSIVFTIPSQSMSSDEKSVTAVTTLGGRRSLPSSGISQSYMKSPAKSPMSSPISSPKNSNSRKTAPGSPNRSSDSFSLSNEVKSSTSSLSTSSSSKNSIPSNSAVLNYGSGRKYGSGRRNYQKNLEDDFY